MIRTEFSDSTSSINGNSLSKPYQEILQGNGSKSITWVLISAPAVEILDKQGYRLSVTSAITKQHSKLVYSIFIDGTDLVVGDLNEKQPDPDRVIESI